MPRMNHRRPVTLARNLVCALTALTVATASCTSLHQVPVVRTIAGNPIGRCRQVTPFVSPYEMARLRSSHYRV